MAEDARDYYERIKLPRPLWEPDCIGCGGNGYVRYERPVGHVLFGKYTTCTKCHPAAAEPEPVEAEPAPWAR